MWRRAPQRASRPALGRSGCYVAALGARRRPSVAGSRLRLPLQRLARGEVERLGCDERGDRRRVRAARRHLAPQRPQDPVRGAIRGNRGEEWGDMQPWAAVLYSLTETTFAFPRLHGTRKYDITSPRSVLRSNVSGSNRIFLIRSSCTHKPRTWGLTLMLRTSYILHVVPRPCQRRACSRKSDGCRHTSRSC